MEKAKQITPIEIKALLADDKLQKVMDHLLELTENLGNGYLYNQVVLQSSKYGQYTKMNTLGTHAYDDLMRTRTNITLALLDIINALPDDLSQQVTKSKPYGVSERSLKKQIFWWLAGGKLLIALYVFFLWQTGTGFTFQGVITVLAVIIPVLATYLGIAYEDVLKNRFPTKKVDFRLDVSIRNTSYFFFMVYFGGIFLALYLHGIGIIPDYGIINNDGKPDYKNLMGVLALIESFIGGYIGILITNVFKSKGPLPTFNTL